MLMAAAVCVFIQIGLHYLDFFLLLCDNIVSKPGQLLVIRIFEDDLWWGIMPCRKSSSALPVLIVTVQMAEKLRFIL